MLESIFILKQTSFMVYTRTIEGFCCLSQLHIFVKQVQKQNTEAAKNTEPDVRLKLKKVFKKCNHGCFIKRSYVILYYALI